MPTQIGRAKTGGRKKGKPNKINALLKDAILKAATDAGNGDLAKYLQTQAEKNPTAFLGLLGKVLPLQVAGDGDNPLEMIHKIERVIVSPGD